MKTNNERCVGVYVHIPFCIRKCYYCDFNSYPIESRPVKEYIDRLVLESRVRGDNACASGIKASSLYIGGGTPTCIDSNLLECLINEVKKAFQIDSIAEITVEANPGTLTTKTLECLTQAGVNRLSIGAQAFQDELLNGLGRIHTVADIYTSYRLLRDHGFSNINLDLMFGIPGQTLKDWQRSIEEAICLSPEHVSAYCLSVEEGTLLQRLVREGAVRLPDDDTVADMWDLCTALLEEAGYEHYETSNYTRESKRCSHNVVYWQNEEYIGLGAGAWSYLGGRRGFNALSPEEYIRLLDEGTSAQVRGEDEDIGTRMTTTMIMGLRMKDGIDIAKFRGRFGISPDQRYPVVIDNLLKRGLLLREGGHLRLSTYGAKVANSVLVEFLE